MILQTDVTFMLFATHVVQEFESVGELATFFELAGLKHFSPFRSPKMIFNYILTILSVYNSAFEYHNLSFVPLAIRFSILGLCGKHVVVNEKIPGVIGARPIHPLDSGEREKSVPVEDLSIDIGASSREEAAEVVRLGDPVTFWSVFDASHGMVKSKAIDDRAGCAILLDLIKKDLPYDMTFVFSVQEEIGLRGAQTAAYAVAPEAAIVVESTTAADIAGVEPGRQVCHVGKGPAVSFMDRGTIYDQGYFQTAFQTAQELQIPCQTKEAVAGGNNAGAIHKSRGGVRTVAVSLPCRYLHSAVGLISQADFHHAEALVEQLAEKIAGGKSDR